MTLQSASICHHYLLSTIYPLRLVGSPAAEIYQEIKCSHGTVSNLEQKFTVDLMKVLLSDDADTLSMLFVV